MTDLLECPVCFENFRDPQTLTACGHTFCKGCLERLVRRVCPTCRAPLPRANAYQPNFALRRLLEDVAARGGEQDMASSTQLTRSYSGQPACKILRTASTSQHDTQRIQALRSLGVPWGLALQLTEEDSQIALRIFLLDNSGSTATHDGQKLVGDRMVTCTRWEETKAMAMAQAEWNARVGTPCEFILLNPPQGLSGQDSLREGIDYVRIAPEAEGSSDEQIQRLQVLLDRTRPAGRTPLVARVKDIHARVAMEKASLATAFQKVFVILVTDGVPTDAGTMLRSTTAVRCDFIGALRKIVHELPVFLVIRLTTDDDNVVDFYNKIDEEVEFPLEVLDDIESEAKEARAKGNGWLTYSPVLHKIREQGTFIKLLDLLDERCLQASEAMVLARLMLQNDSDDMLESDPEDFCRIAADRVRVAQTVYDPLSRRQQPCINVSALYARMIPLSQRLFGWCCARRQGGRGGRQRDSMCRKIMHCPQRFMTWLTVPSFAQPTHQD